MRSRQSRGRLGSYLIERGRIRARDLERALDIQRVAGGHLGTNLLELGVIDEKTLLEAIGKLHDHPTVGPERLRDVPEEVSAMVPRELVRRHDIVPFTLHGNTVYIASQRPGDLHIENEITLATSRLTRTFMALEVRVQEALHRLHGHSLPLRFSRLVAKLDGKPEPPESGSFRLAIENQKRRERSKKQESAFDFVVEEDQAGGREWISGGPAEDPTLSSTAGHSIPWNRFEEGAEGAAKAGEPSPTEDPPATEPPDAEQDEAESPLNGAGSGADDGEKETWPIGQTSGRRERTRSRRIPGLEAGGDSAQPNGEVRQDEESVVAAKRPAAIGGTTEDLFAAPLQALDKALDREEVGGIVMRAFRPFFSRRLLLAKRGEHLTGWRADGPGVRPRNLAGLSFEVEAGTPFLAIENGSRFWLGSYHQDRGFNAIQEVIGRTVAPDCMVMPLCAGGRIIGFLYGDNERKTVTGQPLLRFLEFTEAAGQSLERIILALRERRAQGDEKVAKDDSQPAPDPWATRTAN